MRVFSLAKGAGLWQGFRQMGKNIASTFGAIWQGAKDAGTAIASGIGELGERVGNFVGGIASGEGIHWDNDLERANRLFEENSGMFSKNENMLSMNEMGDLSKEAEALRIKKMREALHSLGMQQTDETAEKVAPSDKFAQVTGKNLEKT